MIFISTSSGLYLGEPIKQDLPHRNAEGDLIYSQSASKYIHTYINACKRELFYRFIPTPFLF